LYDLVHLKFSDAGRRQPTTALKTQISQLY
jgi:hypothetical protein